MKAFSRFAVMFFFGLVLSEHSIGTAQEPPAVGPDAQKPIDPALLNEYLPVLLEKSKLANASSHEEDITYFYELLGTYAAGGIGDGEQHDALEKKLIRAKITVIQQRSAFDNKLDEFKQRFKVSVDGLKQMEKVMLSPLDQHIERIDRIQSDLYVFRDRLAKLASVQSKEDSRKEIRADLTEAALLKGTAKGKAILERWTALQGVKHSELSESRRKATKLENELRAKETTALLGGNTLPEDDRKRLRDVALEVAILDLEMRLSEKKPRRPSLAAALARVAEFPLRERLEQVEKAWPKLATIRFHGGADLIAMDWEKVEGELAARIKKPDTLVAAKQRIRTARALAVSYRLQQWLLVPDSAMAANRLFRSGQKPSGSQPAASQGTRAGQAPSANDN